jgi:tetraacyldisaccharide 4'-kinase
LAIIYGTITWLRNKFFDWGIFKQKEYNIPIISIGNLSMGGTGKTPHIEYLIALYSKTYKIAVISRGYGRKTKGYRIVNTESIAAEVGDEPLQIKQKFENVLVVVCEKRVIAIDKVIAEYPEINLILLDDAFQHRHVKPKISILLTEYSRPFWNDAVVPAGRLREFAFGWRRADAIIVTKCPENNQLPIPKAILSKPLYFSRIQYQAPRLVSGNISKQIVLVTGIANPEPMLNYLKAQNYILVKHFNYPDHYNFEETDIQKIRQLLTEDNLLLTTEKDYMRLSWYFKNDNFNLAYLPIGIVIEDAPVDWLEFDDK